MKVNWSDLYDGATEEKYRESVINIISKNYEAACFLMGSHDSKFVNLKLNLNHSMNVKRDEYPKTLQGEYELVVKTIGNQ